MFLQYFISFVHVKKWFLWRINGLIGGNEIIIPRKGIMLNLYKRSDIYPTECDEIAGDDKFFVHI